MPVRCSCGRQTNNPSGSCTICEKFSAMLPKREEDSMRVMKQAEKDRYTKKEETMKKCPKCLTLQKSNVQRTCHSCGYEFFEKKEKKPSEAPAKKKSREEGAEASGRGKGKNGLIISALIQKKSDLEQEILAIDTAIETIRRYAEVV